MNAVFVLFGIAGGIAVAWILNKLLANKIENKTRRIGLKAAAYIVCIILGMIFAVIGSLRTILDTFLEGRIEFMESRLVEAFPDSNILETAIDISEITSTIDELQQAVNDMDTSRDNFLESLVFGAFLKKLTGYMDTAENGVNTLAMTGDKNGTVTIKSILNKLKDMALGTVSPWFIAGQTAIIILLVIFIGIHAGVAAFLKKGGAMYNKSIVFGDPGE